jgi:hypothetical protein
LGQALPFTGIVFLPTRIKSVGRTTDDRGNGLSGDSSAFKIARDDDVKSGAFGGYESAGESSLFDTECCQRWVGPALPTTTGIPSALAMAQNQDSGSKLVEGFDWHNQRG